jgi:hypothetical protein
MFQQVVHETTEAVDATAPSGIALALAVAKELNGPATRAPEIAVVPQLMGLRTSAEHTHRHKVPLKRLSTVAG